MKNITKNKFNLRSQRAFTLVELLVGLVLSAIVILTIGVISNMATGSHQKVERESSIYNDINYGFKLMQNRVRAATNLNIATPGGNWTGQHVRINSTEAFGICQTAGGPKNFVYMPVWNINCTDPQIIFSVNSTDDLTMSLTQTGQFVTVRIFGTKHKSTDNKIPFDITSSFGRRIQ